MITQALWNLLAFAGHFLWAVLASMSWRSWRRARKQLEWIGDAQDQTKADLFMAGIFLDHAIRQASNPDQQYASGTKAPV